MKHKILIIADDLTGTCDTSIKFLRPNTRISTIVNAKTFDHAILDAEDVVAVNTETRAATPQEAYRCLHSLTRKACALDAILFKKIDSVARGNIPFEIDAVMDAAGLELAVVAPAYPDNGRQCLDGMLRVRDNGDWTDTQKSWPEVLAQSKRKVALASIRQVRGSSGALCDHILALHAKGAGIVVVDAQTNEDLQSIAEAIRLVSRSCRLLPVGCAGLAACMSKELFFGSTNGFIFVVVGTHHPATRRQLKYLQRRTDLSFYTMEASQLVNGGRQQEMRRVLAAIKQDIAAQRIKTGIVLTINTIQQEGEEDADGAASQAIVQALSQTTRSVFESSFSLFDKFLISGGDTANGVLDAFGVRCIHMLGEPLSGIAYGWADLQDDMPRKVWIATKSGGFGEEDTLDTLINYMTQMD